MAMPNHDLEVIAFLSGKGGSGKTTICIGFAKLLADIGFRVLMLDFDFATSGAAYFFLPQLRDQHVLGIAEQLKLHKEVWSTAEHLLSKSLQVVEGLQFLPSRSELGTQLDLVQPSDTRDMWEDLLRAVMGEANGHFDFILIDNQAGYSKSAAAAARVASKAIIVSEADRISSDAVDNLIALMGKDLPTFRRYLVNKVDVREAGQYKQMVDAFRAMNRLPPLPFDFDIRNAFGDRRIPVDVDKPSAFLLALFAAAKEMLPEQRPHLEEYENRTVTRIFDEYQGRLASLLEERDNLRARMRLSDTIELEQLRLSRRFRERLTGLTALMLFSLGGAYLGVVGDFRVPFMIRSQLFAMLLGMGSIAAAAVVLVAWNYQRRRGKLEEDHMRARAETSQMEARLTDLDRDIDRYSNLMAARSRDLLIDFDAP